MRILDSHFHWWPRAVFEDLCKRTGYPRAQPNDKGGYDYWRKPGAPWFVLDAVWFDLEAQLRHMDGLGHEVDVICSTGPFSLHYSDLPPEEGGVAARLWNTQMHSAAVAYPNRLWATAAVPLTDTTIAIDVLNHAVLDLGLVGVNIPGSVGSDPRIDAERLEPFYARVEELGVPLLLHPTDAVFSDMLDGYNGALHLSLGRVIEVSVAAMRLVFSGVMERHPNLKVVMSHTGGALPYQSGRMDKNGKAARLPHPPSTYIRRMYTDTVSPHSLGIKFAVDYYGAEHVMYGSDYPCWTPADALRLFQEIGLSAAVQQNILSDNARKLFRLPEAVALPQARTATRGR